MLFWIQLEQFTYGLMEVDVSVNIGSPFIMLACMFLINFQFILINHLSMSSGLVICVLIYTEWYLSRYNIRVDIAFIYLVLEKQC